MTTRQTGSALIELTGALAGLMVLGSVVVAALGGAKQRTRIEVDSARLEEAQNLLARWRRGEAIVAPGWTIEQQVGPNHTEMLILRADGVRLATVRLRLVSSQANP